MKPPFANVETTGGKDFEKWQIQLEMLEKGEISHIMIYWSKRKVLNYNKAKD